MHIRISDTLSNPSSDYETSPRAVPRYHAPFARQPVAPAASPDVVSDELPFSIDLDEGDRVSPPRERRTLSRTNTPEADLSHGDTATNFATSGSASGSRNAFIDRSQMRSRERSRGNLANSADPAISYGLAAHVTSTYDTDIAEAIRTREVLHQRNPLIAGELRYNDIEARDLRASMEPSRIGNDPAARILTTEQLRRYWDHQRALELPGNAIRKATRIKQKFASSDQKLVARRSRTLAFGLLREKGNELALTERNAAYLAQHVDVQHHVHLFDALPPLPELRKIAREVAAAQERALNTTVS